MFYGQCNTCGERWELGTASTCKCKEDDDIQDYKSKWVGLDKETMRNTTLEFNRGALWAERYLKEKNT
jgi:hypothetical protein